MTQRGCCYPHNRNHLSVKGLAGTKIVGAGKSVTLLDFPVFCDPCQTTSPPSLVLLASFYKTFEILPHICFIVFSPL